MIGALMLMLAMAPGSSPAPPLVIPVVASPSLTEADRAIEAGRLDQAQSMLAAAVSTGLKGEALDRRLAHLAFARGEDERALALTTALLATNPDDALLLERAGIAALKLRRLSEATALLDRATRAEGAGWRAWNARGVAADNEGRWDEADAAYQRAAALAPGRAEVANNRGWSLMMRGEWRAALDLFEQAYAADPTVARLANNRELAQAALDAALPQRRKGEVDDAYAARLNDAGVVAAAAGQAKRAEAAFAQAIALGSRWQARAADNLAALGKPH
ncbi:tetratricopeptide repeat protein [Sphingomonas sp. LY29]|uniref:tetratricopeptide repeat protein n=1 Tax=Sphingomonas sp. LY29 TaxID=3095341 RepID=UPI002D79CF66|nr:tetratricopeptide repeat protein [Sphingomonas sp. LY29]WRP24823.1 tetratricopeptide repeat protein [Sphingomonas sp. LY29]